MISWHIDTDLICLIFMLALHVNIVKSKPETTRVNRSFGHCVIVSIVMLMIDVAASIVMDVPSPRWLYHTLMTLYFASLLMSICAWAVYTAELVYVDAPRAARTARRIALAIYALYVLVVVLNLWNGWLYSLGPNNEYARGPAFALSYIIYIANALALIAFIVIKWQAIPSHYLRWLLVMLPLLLGLGIYAQLAMPGWLTIVPAFSAALLISYLFIQNDWAHRMIVQKQEELRIVTEAASTDTMTRLLNHGATFERIGECLQTDAAKRHALFMIDLDDFKRINDTLGHQAGDDILIEAGARIKRCFRESDIVGRVGGDEFLVLMRNVLQDDIVHRKACELLETLQFDCAGVGLSLLLTASVGIGLYQGDGKPLETLYAETDAALYRAKQAGKSRYALFENQGARVISAEPSSSVHMRTMLENMDGGIVLGLVGERVDFTYVSPSYYRTLLRVNSDGAVTPGNISRQVYPDDLPSVLDACRKAARTGVAAECTYRAGTRGERQRLLRVTRLASAPAGDKIPIICVVTGLANETVRDDAELTRS